MRREIDIQQDGPAKMYGVMNVMALATKQGAELIITCSGEDETTALCREVNS